MEMCMFIVIVQVSSENKNWGVTEMRECLLLFSWPVLRIRIGAQDSFRAGAHCYSTAGMLIDFLLVSSENMNCCVTEPCSLLFDWCLLKTWILAQQSRVYCYSTGGYKKHELVRSRIVWVLIFILLMGYEMDLMRTRVTESWGCSLLSTGAFQEHNLVQVFWRLLGL